MTEAAETALQPKGNAVPVVRSPAQKAADTMRARRAQAEALDKAAAQRLAQVVNLHIAGFSLADIGAAIGASADEVDRLLQRDTARYVRSQPQLRVYVRNWISERYNKLLEANWAEATDKTNASKLENQDRVLRILADMRRLHGADAPVQTEVKVDAAPEAVERLVSVLAAQSGHGYDIDVFDIPAEDIHEAVEQSEQATLDAGEQVGEDQPEDSEWGSDE